MRATVNTRSSSRASRIFGQPSSASKSSLAASRIGRHDASTSGSTPAIALEPTRTEPARSARFPSAPRPSRSEPRAESTATFLGGCDEARSRDMAQGFPGAASERPAMKSGKVLFCSTRQALDEIHSRKEVPALERAVLDGVGAVHGVLAHILPIELTDCSGGCLCRIGSADDRAQRLDGILTPERQHDDRAACHERAELAEERTLSVH